MELDKKTTILFPGRLHDFLSRLARQRGVSLGELVRTACRHQYGFISEAQRLEAVEQLADLSLPVDTPARMKLESIPLVEEWP